MGANLNTSDETMECIYRYMDSDWNVAVGSYLTNSYGTMERISKCIRHVWLVAMGFNRRIARTIVEWHRYRYNRLRCTTSDRRRGVL